MNVTRLDYAVNFLKAGFLLSIVAVCYIISRGSLMTLRPQIAAAVTLDLTVSLPFFYFVFIRKTKISRLTVAPLFVFGIVFASLILPADNRTLLEYLRFFALPVVELGILGYVGFIVYKSRKRFRAINSSRADEMEKLRETLIEEFPIRALANAVVFEISGFYYAVIRWRRRRGANDFTYHRENGFLAMLSVFVFLVAVETTVVHFLVGKLSVAAAWVLTIGGAYFLFQLVAHGKAVCLRPIELTSETLFVRCGLLGDAAIDLANVAAVELTGENLKAEKGVLNLTALGKLTPPNLQISVRDKSVLNGIYGRQKEFRAIRLAVDEAGEFKRQIEIFIAENIEH